jgi:outer membrane usher protein
VAASQANSNSGALALLGVDREAYPWSISARTQWMTNNFAQVGLISGEVEPIQVSSYDVSYATAKEGSVGLAYVVQDNRGQDNTRLATLSYNVSLGKYSSLSLSALRNLGGNVNTTLFATLTITLSPTTNVSVGMESVRDNAPNNSDDLTTTLQRNLPVGEGYGYRITSRTDGYKEGEYSLQNNVGTYSIDVSQSGGATSTQLEAAGGIAFMDGSTFFSRPLTQSFAVAEVPGYSNISIFADNQLVGKTDANGNALIPLLRAYDKNMISIDQGELPMDAEIDSLKVDVVPYFRSGVLAKFPIRHSHGATLTIKLENGDPLPLGASVQILGNDQTFAVGYDGETYLTDLNDSNRLRAVWHDKSCEIDVRYKPSKDPLPDLGVFICRGVKP